MSASLTAHLTHLATIIRSKRLFLLHCLLVSVCSGAGCCCISIIISLGSFLGGEKQGTIICKVTRATFTQRVPTWHTKMADITHIHCFPPLECIDDIETHSNTSFQDTSLITVNKHSVFFSIGLDESKA